MRTKHFLNDPEALVHSSLRSLPLLNPTVALDEENKIVYHRSLLEGKTVRIISGGGSGHEPSFGALVGKGGLAASVAGSVFASPNSRQVLSAIERVKSDGGVLVTVMNYTGDVLNFGVAVEKARTANPQLPIRMLVVGDDVSIPQEKAGKVGRRGIAGTVLVHKITGAAAALGRSLDDVFEIGSFIVRNLASIGASLDRVHLPGHSVGSSGNESLGQDEVELGMGIHNERGMARLKGQEASLSALVRVMLGRVFHSEHSKSTFSSSELGNVVLLVNNLGGVSVLELGAIVSQVREQLQVTYNVNPVRTYAGTLMTSLDGPGFSISMLNLGCAKRETEILELLDAPIEALGWSSLSAGISWGVTDADTVLDTSVQTAAQNGIEGNDPQIETVIPHLRAALNAIILAEPDITRYDDIVGDGDCGTTLKRGAEAVLETISQMPLSLTQLVSSATKAVEASMDGTSGALYSIFFNALTQYIELHYAAGRSAIDAHFWAKALHYATETLSKYTPAKIGDRTMMDALLPFVSTLRMKKDVNAAANAAESGAELTKSMKASLGRAVYVGGETEWMGQIPDPGAWGVSQFLKGLAVSIATSSSPKP